ncbi:flagellar hook-length control protein FliK [Roseibium litorale]|uniref:Flagellar hook-length control protein FliK n=1 Tax=Roseibium litorale TaxID=2803841 RepID=A0ABR9CGQ0_9HYPH|nr:flagellar hook-length control protein FliK [Roseibium litorale]MBD8890060.1 flagellar hook-length control protein FliK [Roseibium litorale]
MPSLPSGSAASQFQMPAASGLKGTQTYPVDVDRAMPETVSGRPVPEPVRQVVDKLLPALEKQQASLADLFANLQAVSAQVSSGQMDVPKPVQTAIEQILGLRLGGQAAGTGQGNAADDVVLSAEDVQRALELSGLFREMVMRPSTGKAAGGDDLKSLLMNLRKLLQAMGGEELPARPLTQPRVPSLRGSPQGQPPAQANLPAQEDGPEALASRLLKDTDGALSRIRLEQLASRGITREAAGQQQGASASQSGGGSSPAHASHSGGGRAMDLVVDLPLAVGGQTAVVQMQIGRDPDHNGDADSGERAWRLRFALDLTATGPMEAAVSLRGGSTYVSLWADREEMHRALNENRESLEAAFAHAGLDLQELRFIRGLPARRRFAAGASVDRQS